MRKVEKRNIILAAELHPVAIGQVSKNPKPSNVSMVRLICRNFRKTSLFLAHLGCYSAFRTNSDDDNDDNDNDDDNKRKLAHPNISAFGAKIFLKNKILSLEQNLTPSVRF